MPPAALPAPATPPREPWRRRWTRRPSTTWRRSSGASSARACPWPTRRPRPPARCAASSASASPRARVPSRCAPTSSRSTASGYCLAPPKSGFNLLVWVVPFAGIGLGLVLVAIVLRRWSRTAPASAPSVDGSGRSASASAARCRRWTSHDERRSGSPSPRSPCPRSPSSCGRSCVAERGRAAASPETARPPARAGRGESRRPIARSRSSTFDHEAGSLSDDDFQALRDRYEGRAAELLTEARRARRASRAAACRRAPELRPRAPGRRSPAAIVAGGLALLALGIALGVGVSRYSAAGQTDRPAGQPHPGAPRCPIPALSCPARRARAPPA